MIAAPLLYTIPDHLADRFASGGIELFGAILKDTATGKIVGHVQETGLLERALHGAGQLGGELAGRGPGGGLTGLIGLAQNEQIKSRLSAMQGTLESMQTLGIADLGASVVGIGVTAASTALLMRQMNRLGRSMEGLEKRMGLIAREQVMQPIHRDLDDLGTSWSRFEEAKRTGEVAERAEALDERLDHTFGHLRGAAGRLTGGVAVQGCDLLQVVAGLALCARTQMNLLLWTDKLDLAADRAARNYRSIEDLGWSLSPDRLARGGAADGEARLATGILADLRRELSSLTHLPQTLRMTGLTGRRYLETAAEADEGPVVYLPRPL